MNLFRAAVVLAAAFAGGLAGCGYQLSGHAEDRGRFFSPVLKRVSVEGLGRYESFRKTLVTALRGHGIRVVAPEQASARLIFSGKHERQRRSAIGDDAKAREYLLTTEVSFSVASGSGKSETLLAEQSVRAEAAYLTDPDRPLLAASEKRTVMKDMEAELCRKILLRLATIADPATASGRSGEVRRLPKERKTGVLTAADRPEAPSRKP